MILIDGKQQAADLRKELKEEVSNLKSKYKKVPGLTVILIGDMTPSQIYVRNKEKSANEIGLKSEVIKYSESIDEKTVLNKIRRFLPNLGSLDISPIILLLLIWFIEMCMKLYIAPIIF